MANIVTKGWAGGSIATRGWQDGDGNGPLNPIPVFQDLVELSNGATPLIRIRLDLDGDGIYEVVEQELIVSVGSISRVLEQVTNKPRYGSGTFTVENSNARWTDSYSKSLTYINNDTTKRYHMSKGIIELGFDTIHKNEDAYWFPLLIGYIVDKQMDYGSKQATIQLLDETSFVVGTQLSKTVSCKDIITYTDPLVQDNRAMVLNTYFGTCRFDARFYKDKDKQEFMIPCTFPAINPLTENPYPTGSNWYVWPNIRHELLSDEKYVLNPYDTSVQGQLYRYKVYLWEWDTEGDNKPASGLLQPEWVEVTYWSSSMKPPTSIMITGFGNGLINCTTRDGTVYDRSFVDYMKNRIEHAGTENEAEYTAEPDIRISCEFESNPAKQLYITLRTLCNLPAESIDASNDDITLWNEEGDYDYESPLYYSFDVSSYYLSKQTCKMMIHSKVGDTVENLIEQCNELTRAGFFIDTGRTPNGQYIPNRRIHYTILQPRLFDSTIRPITESQIRSLSESRSISDIINDANVQYILTSRQEELQTQSYSDTDSITKYGIKNKSIRSDIGQLANLYDCAQYANFLAQHYIYFYAEPPLRVSLTTDLFGFRWDLKKIIGVISSSAALDVTDTDTSGIFEVYGVYFNTSRFEYTFDLQLANYYLAPDGDVINKRWAFCGYSYCNNDPITYHCW